MAKGTVKKVRIEGYGFIATQDTPDGKDIFFHRNNLPENLKQRGLVEGDKVTFNISRTDKGLSAIDIKMAEDTMEETPVSDEPVLKLVKPAAEAETEVEDEEDDSEEKAA